MHIHCNIKLDIDEENYEKSVEHFIYTKNGIYKLYKKHFFLVNLNIKNDVVSYKNCEYFIEDNKSDINKQKLLTHIPYDHYYVLKEIYKYTITDNINLIREIVNGQFVSEYFDINNYDISIFETLCSINK